MTVCRTRCVTKAFKLKRRNNIRTLAVSIFIEFFERNRIITSCYDDCTVFFCKSCFLLVEVNSSGCTGLFTETTNIVFSVFKTLHVQTVIGADSGNLWNCLSKRNIDCFSCIKIKVKAVWNLFVRTFFNTCTTTCTFVFINKARVTFNVYFKVSDITAYTTNF